MRILLRALIVGLGASAGFLALDSAVAATLAFPPATLDASATVALTIQGEDNGDASRTRTAFANLGDVSAFASVTPAPGVFLTAEAQSVPQSSPVLTDALRGEAAASLEYYGQVTGADSSILVPVRYIARLYTHADPAPGQYQYDTDPIGTASAFFWVNGAGYTAMFCTARCGSGYLPDGTWGELPHSLYVEGVTYVNAGDGFSVIESVQALAHYGGAASAWADPYFFIDQGFLDRNPGYGLTFSPGIANNPLDGVPEPATWAIMLLGFGWLGATLRRKRLPPLLA